MLTSDQNQVLKLHAGEVVEVRSLAEILATLDDEGKLEALPFMPEMLQYCGKRFTVYKRADKACDTVGKTGSRRMQNAVHLEGLRCDGTSHGGCQANCLLYWKEAWLKRVSSATAVLTSPTTGALPARDADACRRVGRCTEVSLCRAARKQTPESHEDIYVCQATELPRATSFLAWWDVRQYARDVISGNVKLGQLAKAGLVSGFNVVMRQARWAVFSLGARLRRLPAASLATAGPTTAAVPLTSSPGPTPPSRSFVHQLTTLLDNALVEYPNVRGRRRKTPSTVLDLEPGEYVQVKSKEEIEETLDVNNRNRGLLFDVEMLPYCGGTYRVLHRVERIINERTGKIFTFPNNCVVLEDVVCGGCLSRNRRLCPRSIYPYWHEIWLRRVEREPGRVRARWGEK